MSDYPHFGRYPTRFGDEEYWQPEPEAPKELTREELVKLLGAEPVRNGPTGANHMAYCKQRALEYAPEGQPGDAGLAMSSLMEDFIADPRTADSASVIQHLMLPLAMTGEFGRPGKLRKFILDFS
jgi:hypothetical protein